MEFKSTGSRIALFLMLLGINVIIFSTFAGVTANTLFGTSDLSSTSAFRYINCITAIGVFGLTAYGFAFFVNDKKPLPYLQLNKRVNVHICLILLLTYTVSLPFLSWIITWNEGMKLPEFMSSIESWMRINEVKHTEITARLLSGTEVDILLLNLLTIGLVPAICEELLFRGALLQWFKDTFKNIHVATLLSAIIFSAIHLQFFGFFPRMLMGIYLAYLCVWTGSIWSSIIAHFINNIIIVIAAYLYNTKIIDTDYKDFGNAGDNYIIIFLSIVLTSICVYLVYRKREMLNG